MNFDSEGIANVIKEWWLAKPRTNERRVVHTEEVYDLMRRLSEVKPDGAAAKCEGCGHWIMEEDTYHEWEDGIYTCERCGGPHEDEVGA